MHFAAGHVFAYSARPGTAAARMPDQVLHEARKERNLLLRKALAESGQAYQRRFMGQVLPVLWESATTLGPQGWQVTGLTDNYLRVDALAPCHLWNTITPVRLSALTEHGLSGQIQFS